MILAAQAAVGCRGEPSCDAGLVGSRFLFVSAAVCYMISCSSHFAKGARAVSTGVECMHGVTLLCSTVQIMPHMVTVSLNYSVRFPVPYAFQSP